jgi:hypothetical protein
MEFLHHLSDCQLLKKELLHHESNLWARGAAHVDCDLQVGNLLIHEASR